MKLNIKRVALSIATMTALTAGAQTTNSHISLIIIYTITN